MKLFFQLLLLLALSVPKAWAQKPDHLSMNLQFKDSTLLVEARYQSAVNVNSDSIYFLLNPGFKLDTIVSKKLVSYSVTQKPGIPLPYYRLKFSEARKPRDLLDVAFKYTIDLSEQNHMKSNWIELNTDKLWFPNLGALNNAFTYTITISNFPESYYLVTHTDAKVTQTGNTLSVKKDKPWYEVMVLAGRDLKEFKYNQDIALVGNQKITDATFKSIGEKVKNSIDLLNSYFGKSDPISSFKVVLRNTSRDEIGFQFNRSDMIITGTDFNDYGNLSHEVAHYWWSKANFIKEPWLNESFANYSMYMVLKEFDFAGYKKLLSKNRAQTKNAIPVASANLFAADAYTSYYHKGAIHLIDLEERIGSELMKQLLSNCVARNINTTELFLQELEKTTNKEQRKYFEALLKN